MRYGRMTVFSGPMFASKTTSLIEMVVETTAYNGHGAVSDRKAPEEIAIVLSPKFDDRYSKSEIVSHDGKAYKTNPITNWREAEALLTDGLELVAIDESQFFERPFFDGDVGDFMDFCMLVRGRGIDVAVSGLNMDTEGSPFAITAAAMAMADQVYQLVADCTEPDCGRDATHSHRTSASDDRVELGSSDKYTALCSSHWYGMRQAK